MAYVVLGVMALLGVVVLIGGLLNDKYNPHRTGF